jgi:radical SAM protein with 4Fe4S-binding SPASM domain
LSDEVPRLSWEQFEQQLSRAASRDHLPVAGAFELTYRCNFSCVHCFQQDCRRQVELPAERWCALVDELARAGTLWLTLTGGEPFLHPGFQQVYERAVRAGMLVTVFSNGSSLTGEALELLVRLPPRSLEVTLYGFSPESYRRVTGRAENFELAVEGVRRAAEAGLAVQVKTMVFDETLADFEAIRAFAGGLGLGFRYDTVVHAALGGSQRPGAHRLAPARIAALETADPRTTQTLCERLDAPAPDDRLFRCGAGRRAFSVAPDGALQLCTLLRSPRFDLASHGFAEAWAALGREVERRYDREARCRGCELRRVCSICPGLAAVERGDPQAAVEHLCEIARLRVK